MKNKIVIIGPDSIHVESFIQLIRGAFKEIVFIGEHKLDSKLTDREYVLRSRSIDPFKIIGRYKKIKKIIEKEKPDIVHIHQVNRVAYLASLFLSKTNIPLFVTAWGSDVLLVPKRNAIAKYIIQSVLRTATFISGDSQHMIKAINELAPSQNNTNLIFFGIEPIPFNRKEKIIYSNRLHELLYNIDIIIDEFYEFQKKHNDWKLVIAGEGKLTKSLQTRVKNLNIANKVSFEGWLDKEKNETIYKRASIYVSIPSSDGTSVSLLEAMSAGCIPIVGDIPVSHEWVEDGINGVIRNGNSGNIFTRALELNQENVQNKNTELINSKATKRITANKYHDLYNTLPLINKVCHITTVHQRFDVRIFFKECTSLSNNYEVHLIVADGKGDEVKNGIHIHDIGLRQDSRLFRAYTDSKKALKKAKALKCQVYHFHDPELIITASKLLKKRKKVIYDVHEDLPRQIYGKPYLTNFIKPFISKLIEFVENRYARRMSAIITATPYIYERFIKINKNTLDVNNFPLLNENLNPIAYLGRENNISYVGGIFANRGVYELIESLKHSKVQLLLAGEFESDDFKKKCQSSEGWKYVKYYGFVSREEIAEILNKSKIGIVSLYPLRNYLDSLPIKMFEYMLAGIPVIASDFPYWKRIIDEEKCGVNVNPKDVEAIVEKTRYLIQNEHISEEMGKKGRKAILNNYNWCNEEEKLLSIYKELLD